MGTITEPKKVSNLSENENFEWLLKNDEGESIAWKFKDQEESVIIKKEQSLVEIDKAIHECRKKFVKNLHRMLVIKDTIQKSE